MEQFSYSFIIAMLHSIWQTALLLFVYFLLMAVHGKASPMFKRNLLYAIVGLQLLSTFFTFYIVYNETGLTAVGQFAFAFESALQGSWLADNSILLFYLYALVFIFRLCAFFVSWEHFKMRYQQSLVKPGIDIRLFTQTKADQFGIRKKVAIWCSNSITSPMTFGFWKPVILMPVALLNQLSLRETEALIIHELTHIRHFDYLLNRLLLIVENIFFFNPFIHIVAQQIKLEREKNCDQQVLMFNYDQVQYAEALLKAAMHQQKLTMQMAAVKRKDQLLQRIRFFSNPQHLQFRQGPSLLSSLVFVAAIFVNCLLVALFLTGPALQPAPVAVVNHAAHIYMPATSEAGKIFTAGAAAKHGAFTAAINETAALTVKLSKSSVAAIKPKPELTVSATQTPAVFYVMPAANAAPTLYEGKEIRITEASSDGTKITAVYQAILIEGVWSLQPLWMVTETNPSAGDSLKITTKDSVIRIYPTVQ